MTLYPIRAAWDLDVLDPANGWRRRRSRATLPLASAPTGYGTLKGAQYRIQSRYTRKITWPGAGQDERAFLRLDGVLHGATVLIDGVVVGTARGGYGAVSFEVTSSARWGATSVLEVEVDSRQRVDVPPLVRPSSDDAPSVDFHAFGGLSRNPSVEVVPAVFVAAARALPKWGSGRVDRVVVTCFLDWPPAGWAKAQPADVDVDVSISQDGVLLGRDHATVPAEREETELSVAIPATAKLWSPETPRLVDVRVEMSGAGGLSHQWDGRIGLRVAAFERDGLYLNGRCLKIRGLSRHELFPYLGPCAPARLHRMDVRTIKEGLGCNLVRTAHYPQSPEFLDACDEAGLLVFEETPGWGHLGDKAWREVVCRDVAAMVRRDWNHPSIVMWGIRCNESPHDGALYRRTNAIAHELDPSRATGGAREASNYEADIVEDVSCYNDYSQVPRPANHQPFVVSEFVGAITPGPAKGHVYHRTGSMHELEEQGLRHARFYDGVLAGTGDSAFAGAIGWVAFDYHSSSGDHRRWREVKTPGICDLFRIPKLAAGFYSSQRDVSEVAVLEANFVWDEEVSPGEQGSGSAQVWVWTNAESVRASIDGAEVASGEPAADVFANLAHPPVRLTLPVGAGGLGELLLEGLVGGAVAARRRYCASRDRDRVVATADDPEVTGDGCDATRVVVGVTDRFGNPRYVHTGIVTLSVEGPGEIIGPSELDLGEIGGIAATFIAGSSGASGKATLTAACEGLGAVSAAVSVIESVAEDM